MKNKKLALSLLSTAVVSSMAASAYAADSGFYIGGDVKHFYTLDSFFAPANDSVIFDEANSVGLDHVVYVDDEGKAATLDAMFEDEDSAFSDDLDAVFGEDGKDEYTNVDENGDENGSVEPPAPGGDVDGPVVDEAAVKVNDDLTATVTGKVEKAEDVRVTLIDSKGEYHDYLASEGQVTLNEDGTFTFTSEALTAGEWEYEVSAIAADGTESEVKGDKFTVAAAALEVESVSATTETGKDATIYTNVDGDKSVKVVSTAKDAAGAVVEGVNYSFTSSNPAVATVAEDGTVTAVADGSATITVKTTNAAVEKTATVTVTVDTQLKTTAASASSARVVEVTFSTPVDGSALFNNKYSIYKADFTTVPVDSVEFVPGSNNTKVLLHLGADVALNTAYTLRVNGVNDADGLAILEANKNFNFTTGANFDTTKPAIVGDVVATSSTKFEVTLNKEVQDTAALRSISSYNLTKKEDDSAVTISSVVRKSAKVLEFTVSTKLIDGKAYQLDINAGAITDLVGNTMDAVSNKEFVGKSDTVAPALQTAAPINQNAIELAFDKNIDLVHTTSAATTKATVALFEVTANGDKYLETVVDGSSDGTEIAASTVAGHTSDNKYAKVKTSTNLQAGKTYKVVVTNFENDDDIVGTTEVAKTFTIAPINVQSAEKKSANVLTYTFDQKVATNKGNFILYKLNTTTGIYDYVEEVIPGSSVVAQSAPNENKLDVTYLANIDAGATYKTVISGVEHAAYTGVAYAAQQVNEVTVPASATNKVVLQSAAQVANQSNKVNLVFDKDIDVTSATVDVELYKGTSTIPVKVLADQTLVAGATTKEGVLTLTGVTLEEGATYTLKVKEVKTAGATDLSDLATVTFTGKDYVAPGVASAALVDGNKLVLTFTEAVDISAATFKLLAANGTDYVDATTSQSFDKKTVTLTGASQISTAWGTTKADQVTLTGSIKDTSPQANAIDESALDSIINAVTAVDTAKPVAVGATIDNGDKDALVITFSEKVLDNATGNTFSAVGADFALSGFGAITVTGAAGTATPDNKITLALSGDVDSVVLNQGNLKVSLTDATAVGDAAATPNFAASFANLKVTENVAPAVATATGAAASEDSFATNDTITLAFNEELLTSSLTASDVTVTVTDKNGDNTVLTGADLQLTYTNDATVVVKVVKTGVNLDLSSGGGSTPAVVLTIAANAFEDKSNVKNSAVSEDVIGDFTSN